MNDENNLSIGIRARILPVIEGADQLKAEISNLPTSISSRMQETIQSPAFREGLTQQQIKKVESLTGLTTDSYEFEKIQERQKEITDDLQIDLDRGKLTLAQQKKHLGRFAKYGQSIEGYGEFVSSELDDERYSFLSQSQKAILRASATQGTQEAVAGISGVNQKFEQINYANEYVRNIGKLEKEQFQRQKNLEYDVEEGVFTKTRGQRYLREEYDSIRKMEEMQQEAKEKFGGTEFGDRVFKTMGDDIEAAKLRMKDFGDEIEKAGKGGENLLQNLKSMGVLAVASTAVKAGLDYWTAGKQIEAAERTSFDFSSPMGMYSQQRQFELFKENTERSRDYKLAGGLGGAVAGGLAGIGAGPAGVLLGATAGYFGGSSFLGQYAEGLNIEKSGEVNEQLKRKQQVYGQLNSMVSGSSGYDILRARTRARIGSDAIGSLGLGYMPEEELQMRNTFADMRGKWDEELYGEQTTFARAKGIDPNAIYNMNLTARMTGMDVGIGGLDKARQIATATYGENVTSQRIVDVLNDLKNINERMLDVNMNMDSREATNVGLLPSLIFGKDSAYGQLGNRAPQGLSAIERLGAGGSNAEDAWLYRAYGGGDLNKFYERKREGIYSLENFNAIASQLNRDFGGNEWMIERRLNTMPQFSDFKTAGIIPKLAQSIAEHPYGYTQEDFKKIKNDPDFKERNMGDYQKDAAGAVSATEKNRAEQQTIMNQIGDDYRKMINKMGLDWLSTWRDLSTSANNYKIIQDQLNDVLGESIKRFKEFFVEGGKSAKEFEEWKKREELESNRFQPKKEETEDDQTTKKSLQQLDNKFKLQHSPSYDEWKNKHTPIKDAHGIPAEGFVAEEMSKLQKALSESPLGMRYRTSLYEGDATTGHAPGSPHYTGKAFDTSLYDKVANKKIDADNYPPEVKTFYQQFADEHGLKYGGSFKRSFRDGKFIAGPDNNHFQEGSPVNGDESHSEFNRIKSVVERDKEYQKEYQEDTRKQLLMRSEYEKYGISILPSYRISGNELSPKSMSEVLKKALQHRNESYGPISESAYKRKDQSFFEPSSKIKNEKNEGNFNFDPNAIKEAILQGFRELSGRGNDQKEIIIRDKTANGITSEHMETSRRNANSFYNGR